MYGFQLGFLLLLFSYWNYSLNFNHVSHSSSLNEASNIIIVKYLVEQSHVDVDTKGNVKGTNLRIQVLLDIGKPLWGGVKLTMGKEKTT